MIIDNKASEQKENPVCLRVWYPRVVKDESFEKLIKMLKYIGSDRVYIFDNSYMDNYQLAPETLAERIPVLKKRVLDFQAHGILMGINSGATIGHSANMDGAERLMALQWWAGADGVERPGIACPISTDFLTWVKYYFGQLAQTGTKEIWIDDDLRMANHGVQPNSWGCFCDLHISEFNRRFNHNLTRQELLEAIGKLEPGAVQKDWVTFLKDNIRQVLINAEQGAHEINPELRLGLMPIQNTISMFGKKFYNETIELVSEKTRPLLRIHNYHGMPHEMTPGSGRSAKFSTTRKDSQVFVEIENQPHNTHEYRYSPKLTRYAMLTALALGMGGATITFGDSFQELSWEWKVLDMVKESDAFFRTVTELTNGTELRGVPVRDRVHQRETDYFEHTTSLEFETRNGRSDVVAGMMGFAYQFEYDMPALLLGDVAKDLTPEHLKATLERGAIIDINALQCLEKLGYADQLGARCAGLIGYRRGYHYNEHPLNAEYSNTTTALREQPNLYKIEVDPDKYEEVIQAVSWTGRRVGGVAYVQKDGKGRNVIVSNVISKHDPYIVVTAETQYRAFIKQALAYALGQPLHLYVDGPPNIQPYYLERKGHDSVVITLLNAYYDDLYDFDLVLGDGARLMSKTIYRVMPDGSIKPQPSLKISKIGNQYRLKINQENMLENSDILVLVIK